MSFSIVERIVIEAVKGTPACANSRTEHFRARSGSQTPFSDHRDYSSHDGLSTDSDLESGTMEAFSTIGETEDQYQYEES